MHANKPHGRRSYCLAYVLLGTMFGVIADSPAEASDSKYFNGAFCRVSHAPSVAPDPVEYWGNGSVVNRQVGLGNPLDVVCPIVRDTTDETVGWDSIKIGYFDKTNQDNIQCTAIVGSFVDGTTAFSTQGFSQDNGAAVWKSTGMTLGNPGGSLVDAFYYLRCRIPGAVDNTTTFASGIAYYLIQEP